MTTDPATATDLKRRRHAEEIATALRAGCTYQAVIAKGTAVLGGWRRGEVDEVLTERGWRLGIDGRIPAEFRARGGTDDVAPPRAVPNPRPLGNQQPAAQPTAPRMAAPPSELAIEQLIAAGKRHPVSRIQHLARRADANARALREALAEEVERDGIRKRLAEVEAEREELRAKLRPPRTQTVPAARAALPAGTGASAVEEKLPAGTSEANGGKPINHGTWGGWMSHNNRGEHACADCEVGKDEQMAAMRAKQTTEKETTDA